MLACESAQRLARPNLNEHFAPGFKCRCETVYESHGLAKMLSPVARTGDLVVRGHTSVNVGDDRDLRRTKIHGLREGVKLVENWIDQVRMGGNGNMESTRVDASVREHGGEPLDRNGVFKIGERNYTVLRKVLWKNNILIAAESVGGTAPRTLKLRLKDGLTTIRMNGSEEELK